VIYLCIDLKDKVHWNFVNGYEKIKHIRQASFIVSLLIYLLKVYMISGVRPDDQVQMFVHTSHMAAAAPEHFSRPLHWTSLGQSSDHRRRRAAGQAWLEPVAAGSLATCHSQHAISLGTVAHVWWLMKNQIPVHIHSRPPSSYPQWQEASGGQKIYYFVST